MPERNWATHSGYWFMSCPVKTSIFAEEPQKFGFSSCNFIIAGKGNSDVVANLIHFAGYCTIDINVKRAVCCRNRIENPELVGLRKGFRLPSLRGYGR